MTVIRRPAYVTHSCPPPGSNGFWESSIPSRVAQLKSQSARRYLEEQFATLMKEKEQRQQRFYALTQEVQNSGLSQEAQEQVIRDFMAEENEYSRLSRSRLSSTRYHRIKLSGRGGFGDVWLVQDKTNGGLFALKILRKSHIILKDQLLNVRTERDILSNTVNPWIVQLHYSFQDSHRLYLVLEYVCGGDLMTCLIKRQKFDERTAKFFAGEIAMALNSIHQMHYLHRDLKPDNVLIGRNGHIKLTDFGLSTNYAKQDICFQKLMDEMQEAILEQTGHTIEGKVGTHHERGTAVGTVCYTSPEVLQGLEPSPESDFWSLGVVLYEMLFGFIPFVGKSPRETGLRIMHWKRVLKFPKECGVSTEAIDLIQHLICDQGVRFGYQQIVGHPFFRGFRFDDSEANIPPLVPILRSPTDTSHFDNIEPGPEEQMEEFQNGDLAKFAFLGFTWKPPRSSISARIQPNRLVT
jgi:serine/threonine protein kinase